jgi:hypothetical protein
MTFQNNSALFLLSSVSFAVLYPLLFWITRGIPLKNTFHQFNATLVCVIGSFSLFGLTLLGWKMPLLLFFWWITFMSVSACTWNFGKVPSFWILILCLLGIPALFQVQGQMFSFSPLLWAMSILAGLIFSISLYSGILGHWYIEMKRLSLLPLQRITNLFGVLLGIRLLADGVILCSQDIIFNGDKIPLSQFILMSEGVFLWVALLFGTVFPLVLIFFVLGTIREGSHTSATGILYVIFVSILIGEFTTKYYWIQYRLFL